MTKPACARFFFLALCFFSIMLSSCSGDSSWEQQNQKLLKYYAEKSVIKAIPKAEVLLANFTQEYGSNHIATATAAHNLSAIYANAGAMQKADSLAGFAMKAFQKMQLDYELALAMANLGNIESGAMKIAGTESESQYHQASETIGESRKKGAITDLAGIYYNRAITLINSGAIGQAEKQLVQALALLEADNDLKKEYATGLELKALLYSAHMGRFAQARAAFDKSFEIRLSRKKEKTEFQHGLFMMLALDPDRAADFKSQYDERDLHQAHYPHYQPSDVNPQLLRLDFPAYYKAPAEIATGKLSEEEVYKLLDFELNEEIDEDEAAELDKYVAGTAIYKEFEKRMTSYSEQLTDRLQAAIDSGALNHMSVDSLTKLIMAQSTANPLADIDNLPELINSFYSESTNENIRRFGEYGQKASEAMYGKSLAKKISKNGLINTSLNAFRQVHGEYSTIYRSMLFNKALTAHGSGKHTEAREHYTALMKNHLAGLDMFQYASENERKAMIDLARDDQNMYYQFVKEVGPTQPGLIGQALNFRIQSRRLNLDRSAKIQQLARSNSSRQVKDLYKEWISLKEKIAQGSQLTEQEKKDRGININLLLSQANDKERQLAAAFPALGQQLKTKDNWRDLKRQLPPNTSALEIVRLQDAKLDNQDGVYFPEYRDESTYLAFVISASAPSPKLIEIGKGTSLEKQAYRLYREFTSEKFDRSNRAKYQAITEAYWQPIAAQLPVGTKSLFISTDGIYNQINLNVLPVGNQGVLYEQFEINYLSGLSAGLPDRQRTNNQSIALFGNPTYEIENATPESKDENRSVFNSARGTGSMIRKARISPLPGTAEEVQQIASVFDSLQLKRSVYLETQASEDMVKSIGSASILHLATHGYFDNRNSGLDLLETGNMDELISFEQSPLLSMLNSGLLFSGVKNYFDQVPQEHAQDGILTAYEASTLPLENTDLVVLSACNSGRGFVDANEGVYGLQRAFKIAGAGSVIMSMWKVNDEMAAQLMAGFYKYWLQGHSKAAALRLAQSDIRKTHPEPFFWGAFMLLD